MAISEAARADLYTGFVEVFGPERAETLMAHLPRFDLAEVATSSDIARIEDRIDHLEDRIGRLEDRMTRFEDGLAAVNLRLDRLFLALVGGLLAVIAAMAGLAFTLA